MHTRFLVVSLLVASAANLCVAVDRPSVPSGHWEGVVQIPGFELRVVVDLARNNQEWIGSLTAPQLEIKGAQLTGIAIKENQVEFALKRGVLFKGQFEPGGVLKGEYLQGGNKAPFLLKRVGDAQVDLPPLSTAVSSDIQGEWKGALQLPSTTINLILKLPNGGTPTAPAGELALIEPGDVIPITLWREDGKSVLAILGDGALTYHGEIRKDVEEIAGSVRLGGAELPVTFRRSPAHTPQPSNQPEQPRQK